MDLHFDEVSNHFENCVELLLLLLIDSFLFNLNLAASLSELEQGPLEVEDLLVLVGTILAHLLRDYHREKRLHNFHKVAGCNDIKHFF